MKKHLLALSVLSILVPCSAQADATFNSGSAYGGIGGGIVIPQNTNISVSGAITGAGQIHYKDGAGITGSLGYHFNDYFAGEAQIGYSRVNYNHVSGTLSAGTFGSFSGNLGIDGHASAFTGLLNGIVTPFHNLSFSPYIGGGIGFARTSSHINSLNDGVTTLTVDSSDSKTDFAADALVGFDVPVAKGFSLGGRYQYLWINSGTTSTDGGVTGKEGNFGANVITAQATFKF